MKNKKSKNSFCGDISNNLELHFAPRPKSYYILNKKEFNSYFQES